jgi:hypothetical protein
MIADGFTWIVAHHELAHVLVGLGLMALICPVLQFARVYGFAWHAAAYVSLFFYTREAAQAERALKPVLGDPTAFFWTLWPGHWTAGGARLWEWLAPTIAVLIAAALSPRRPFLFTGERPEIRLPGERPLPPAE